MHEIDEYNYPFEYYNHTIHSFEVSIRKHIMLTAKIMVSKGSRYVLILRREGMQTNYTHINVLMHICIHINMKMHIHAQTCTHTHEHIHTHIHTHTHTQTLSLFNKFSLLRMLGLLS